MARGWDWRFSIELIGAMVSPLVGPAGLWLSPPDSDVGEIFAFLGWPLLYFLGGLFASGFDQPKQGNTREDEASIRMKWTAHNLRVAWLFFLLLFEGLAAVWILSGYQRILLPFVLTTYATYALLVVLWLSCARRIREC